MEVVDLASAGGSCGVILITVEMKIPVLFGRSCDASRAHARILDYDGLENPRLTRE